MIYFSIFFIFLLIFIPITVVFAEPSSDATRKEIECTRITEYISENPDSRNALCNYKNICEDFRATISDEKIILNNDYLTQQFLHKNPGISLDDASIGTISNMFVTDTWLIPDIKDHYPRLGVTFDVCGNITEYKHRQSESGNGSMSAKYPIDDQHHEKVQSFREDTYEITKNITGLHPSPRIQINTFNIHPNEIHCNDGLELYIRNNNIPVCLKEQTYDTLLERGFNLQKTIS